eukprot:353880-Chlamydomonas_euryale.AAC.25
MFLYRSIAASSPSPCMQTPAREEVRRRSCRGQPGRKCGDDRAGASQGGSEETIVQRPVREKVWRRSCRGQPGRKCENIRAVVSQGRSVGRARGRASEEARGRVHRPAWEQVSGGHENEPGNGGII